MTDMVCKLAQLPPNIGMTFPLEAKKWLLEERKRQQQEDDKLKKSSNSNSKDNSNMPSQYSEVKNVVKGEDEVQNQIENSCGLIDDFLEDVIKSSNLYEEQAQQLSNISLELKSQEESRMLRA